MWPSLEAVTRQVPSTPTGGGQQHKPLTLQNKYVTQIVKNKTTISDFRSNLSLYTFVQVLMLFLTLTGCLFTMRRMSVSANTALCCTTCIHVVYCMLYSK